MPPVRKAVIAPIGTQFRHYPASSAMSALLFPLVDRDGLTKPIVQIVAEEATDSGIESVGIIVTEDEEAQCRKHFQRWPIATATALAGHDWARLQCEKLAAMSECISYIRSPGTTNFDARLLSARSFVGDDAFLLLPSDEIYVSGTKDRCAGQLLEAFERVDPDRIGFVEPILFRDAALSTVVRASPSERPDLIREVEAIVERPTLDQATAMSSPGLPPGQIFRRLGMAVYSPRLFGQLDGSTGMNSSAGGDKVMPSCIQQSDPGFRSHCVTLIGNAYGIGLPYGMLESQLAMALAGIHRVEICEMIARTLAEQAKS